MGRIPVLRNVSQGREDYSFGPFQRISLFGLPNPLQVNTSGFGTPSGQPD